MATVKIRVDAEAGAINLHVGQEVVTFVIRDGITDDYGAFRKALDARLRELQIKKQRSITEQYKALQPRFRNLVRA